MQQQYGKKDQNRNPPHHDMNNTRLPPDEDLNEWLAVHVVDFFNRINLIYGTISDFCTPTSCPTMSGGPQYEWVDVHDVAQSVGATLLTHAYATDTTGQTAQSTRNQPPCQPANTSTCSWIG